MVGLPGLSRAGSLLSKWPPLNNPGHGCDFEYEMRQDSHAITIPKAPREHWRRNPQWTADGDAKLERVAMGAPTIPIPIPIQPVGSRTRPKVSPPRPSSSISTMFAWARAYMKYDCREAASVCLCRAFASTSAMATHRRTRVAALELAEALASWHIEWGRVATAAELLRLASSWEQQGPEPTRSRGVVAGRIDSEDAVDSDMVTTIYRRPGSSTPPPRPVGSHHRARHHSQH